jgi:hypothetical protein
MISDVLFDAICAIEDCEKKRRTNLVIGWSSSSFSLQAAHCSYVRDLVLHLSVHLRIA